jgi:aerobic carbon-monoxide dehydrogenase medium subunit
MERTTAGMLATSQYGLPPFRLSRPRNLAETLAVLAEADEAPVLLAGGTDIFAALREGLQVAHLVDLARVEELRAVELAGGELRIGAGVTHETGSAHPLVARAVPGFAAAWRRIANVRVRMAATLGGNLMARRPRYEGSLLLTALSARLRFRGPDAPFERSPEALWREAMPARALLHSVAVPVASPVRFAYDRSLRPIATLAVAVAGAPATGFTGRAAVATERLPPVALDLELGGIQGWPALDEAAARIAAAAFETLPRNFADEMTGNDYLRQAGRAMLARRLRELARETEA